MPPKKKARADKKNNKKKNLNDLSEELLRAIFLNIPLQERISYRAICRLWRRIIEDTFRLVRSLKLFDSFQLLSTYYAPLLMKRNMEQDQALALHSNASESDDLVIGGARVCQCDPCEYFDFVRGILSESEDLGTQPDGRFLVELFPNVERLIMGVAYVSTKIDVEYIVHSYSPQLTTLGLFEQPSVSDGQIIQYVDMPMDHLTNLRKLYLNQTTLNANLDLTLLEHLETLAIDTIYEDGRDFELLMQFPHQTLKHLVVDNLMSESVNIIDKISNRNAQLVRQLETLSIGHFFLDQFPITAIVESVCTRFVSLEKLHLNLQNSPDHLDAEKSVKFFVTQFARLKKLTNLSFKIESDYFNIPQEDLASIPVLKKIQNLTLQLISVNSCVVEQLERSLSVIFPNARSIKLRTPYRDEDQWQEGARDLLVEMVQRNGPIMVLDRTEELEADVTPLLGRSEPPYQTLLIDENKYGSYEVESDDENSDDEEYEYKPDTGVDHFVGISEELLTLLHGEAEADASADIDPFDTQNLEKKLTAMKRVLSMHTQTLFCEGNYESIFCGLNELYEQQDEANGRQALLLILDCMRLLVSEAKPANAAKLAESWTAIMLIHFKLKNSYGEVVTGLNHVLDAFMSAITVAHKGVLNNQMIEEIRLAVKNPNPSIRKAAMQLIYRALCQLTTKQQISCIKPPQQLKGRKMNGYDILLNEAKNRTQEADVKLLIQLADIQSKMAFG